MLLPLSQPAATRRPAATCRCGWLGVAALVLFTARLAAAGPFADAVVQFRPGAGAGYGQDQLPGIVLGPPRGGGMLQGSLDVVSLGHGGEIVLQFDPPVACDGPGPDLLVFENAFHIGSESGPVFAELAFVAVSQDGIHFYEFPWDPQTWQGLAGKSPVLSNPENGIDPTDPSRAGGDAFDLQDLGLPWIRFVRITDAGDTVPDPGNRLPGGGMAGFDLDAVAAVHPCNPFAIATPTPSPASTRIPSVGTSNTATATPSPSPTPSPQTPPGLPCTILDSLLSALFSETPAADWNDDGRLSVADAVELLRAGACGTSGPR
jgi:hypothetical protein